MRLSLSCVLLLLGTTSAALADQVTLQNGDRLTGTIVSGDGKTLLMKSEFAGDVTIQWGAITAIESAQNLNLTLKDGKRLAGKVTTSDGKFVVAGAEGANAKDAIVAVRNDADQKAFDLAADRIAHPKFTYFWSGLFDTGLALTRGNSSTVSYTFNSKAIRETPRDKLTLYGNYIYASDSTAGPGRTTANALGAGARGDLNIGERLFVFAFADYATNALQHLDLRQVYGGGFGYHAIKTARNTLDLFGGISYDRDAFGAYSYTNSATPPQVINVNATTLNTAAAVFGEEFDSHLSKRSLLSERFSIYPNLTNTGEYRFQFNTTLATQLKAWLSWQTSFSDIYISYPPPNLKGNDLVLSTGLRVAWGKAKLWRFRIEFGSTEGAQEAIPMGFLMWILVGLIAGWLAGQVMKGGGYGVLVDIILGILGGFVGGWVFGLLHISLGGAFLGPILVSFVGAVILVWITRLVKKA